MPYIVYYISTLVVMGGFDAIWLTVMGNKLYRPVLGDTMLDKPRIGAAIAFYLIYVTGVTIFAGSAAFRTGSWTTATLYGALFGFFCYATYDLTNQATLRPWAIQITLADICWGTVLTGVSATAAYFITRAIKV
jgi:uncharacterized membrane protein